jgi:hypothetical protein
VLGNQALRGSNNRPTTMPQRQLDNENIRMFGNIWDIHSTQLQYIIPKRPVFSTPKSQEQFGARSNWRNTSRRQYTNQYTNKPLNRYCGDFVHRISY